MRTEFRRISFNVTPEQRSEMERLKESLGALTMKEAILKAVRIANLLARDVNQGRSVYLMDETGAKERLILLEAETE
jgi:hypothetical protein